MPRLAIAWVLLLASISFGQSLDRSTPRGALKLFYQAQTCDDGDTLHKLLVGDNAAEYSLISAVADQKNADRALTDALITHFPDQYPTDPRKTDLAGLPAVYEKIDQAEQQITGDTATLRAADADSDSPPITLRRVDGQWRIPLAVLFPPSPAAELLRRAHQIEIQVNVMRQAAIDVAGGIYATKDQAVDAIKEQMLQAGLADHTASTQPATQP